MKYLTTFISLCLPLCLKADKQPNIVFFFTDDQTSSSLGCYGHPLAQTPNLDRLAAEGTRFSNACVSQSICWVSRTTILTGLTGRSFGSPSQPDQATPESVRELYPDILRDHGSSTWAGEELALTEVTQRLILAGIQCHLLLIPRHAERRGEIRYTESMRQHPRLKS